MIFPAKEDLPLKLFMIYHGEHGRLTWKFYNDPLGIKLTKVYNRNTGKYTDTWEMDRLPGQFSSYEELRKAAEGIK